jgi:hypothetical protein
MAKRSMEKQDQSKLVEVLAKAGARGLTQAEIAKKMQFGSESQIALAIKNLKTSGAIRGPFQIGRSKYYFDAINAPTREHVEKRIEELLRGAGVKVTSRSSLQEKMKGTPLKLFKDALSSLKAEGKIVELRGASKSTMYVHREPILEQLRLPDAIEADKRHRTSAPPPPKTSISLDEVRPVYEALKTQQGGISAVKIYDIMKGVGVSKEDLHRFLLTEAQRGRVTLHPASTVNFPREVIEAGISLDGQPYPFVTVVLKEGA